MHDVLGFTDMAVTSYPHDPVGRGGGADMISPAFGYGNGTKHPQAVGDLELARYGPDPTYPWEVLGSGRDVPPGFSFTQPRSATVVLGEVRVSGRGAPANAAIRIEALAGTKRPISTTVHAGGNGTWTGVVAIPLPHSAGPPSPRQVITLVATVGQQTAHPALVAVRGVQVG